MKFLVAFLTALTLLCGVFWLTDAAGSGMGYAAAFFGVLDAGALLFNKLRTGAWLSDKTTR